MLFCFCETASKDNVTVAVISIVTQKWFSNNQDGLLLLIKQGHIYRKETINNKDELWVL